MGKEVAASEEMKAYFHQLEDETEKIYKIASEARAVGKDPSLQVEVPRAADLASRVETLLADYHVEGLADIIRDLSTQYDNREVVAIKAAEIYANKPAESREQALDRAVRIGLAIVTEGILVAPLEGIACTRLRQNADGSEFADLVFAGPIRASGGTGQALSVLICDVVRQAMGIGPYIPTEGEVGRFMEEIPLYKQCQHLQFTPSDSEIKTIVSECPVMVDGEGTEDMEISGFRDLPRIETNRVRGGACLVIAEGMCLKASKIKKHVDKLGIKGWDFIQKYLDAHKNVGGGDDGSKKKVVEPSTKYLKDMVAGRPIFGHPCKLGGFRLRYGRARTSGLASLAYNPASMYAMDEFLALGTQLKIERPGKACVVTPVRSIEGPTLLLKNGDLVYCDTKEDYLKIKNSVYEVVDNGEILVPFGEFCENNHVLVPSGYPIEWHREELKDILAGEPLPDDWEHPTFERAKEMCAQYGVALHPDYNLFWSDIPMAGLKSLRAYVLETGQFADGKLNVPRDDKNKLVLETLGALHVCRAGRVIICEKYSLPLLEGLGLALSDGKIVSIRDYDALRNLRALVLEKASVDGTGLTVPVDPANKAVLRNLGIPFRFDSGTAVLAEEPAKTLLDKLGLGITGGAVASVRDIEDDEPLNAVSYAAGYMIRARAMTRIGTRMGRPEKAKERAGSPLVQALFPLSDEKLTVKDTLSAIKAINQRNAQEQLANKRDKNLYPDMGYRVCPSCGRRTYSTWCRTCLHHTEVSPEKKGPDSKNLPVDIQAEYDAAMEAIRKAMEIERKVSGASNEADFQMNSADVMEMGSDKDSLRCCEKLTSRTKTPEILEKGILRRKHNISIFRDGTIRYDMTDIPLTHFRPREIGLSVEKAHELGYTHDWDGNPLTDPEQICELKCQDIIPARECGDYMVRVANFIDDELRYIYGLPRYYNATSREDLIGQLTFGLAPHTSGCILCRIIGYAGVRGCYGHPFYHASKRRNCDGDEDCIILALDGLLNFSKVFLPSRRGGLMDSPLVLTTRLDPNEIDKEAQNVDCLRAYPKELYRAAMDMQEPKTIEKIMDLVGGRIGTEKQYEGIGYTHDTPDISEGPRESAYTTLGSMIDKMAAQLELGEKCRSVDARDVALKVINKHFMPDMIGNLRSFATQKVRCTRCGESYRRIPLSGVCAKCGYNLILTVTEPSVRKYLEVSKNVCERNNLDGYTKERIDIIEQAMDSLFHNDKVKKLRLDDFF